MVDVLCVRGFRVHLLSAEDQTSQTSCVFHHSNLLHLFVHTLCTQAQELRHISPYAAMYGCDGNVGIRNRLRGEWREEGGMKRRPVSSGGLRRDYSVSPEQSTGHQLVCRGLARGKK